MAFVSADASQEARYRSLCSLLRLGDRVITRRLDAPDIWLERIVAYPVGRSNGRDFDWVFFCPGGGYEIDGSSSIVG